MNEKVIGSQEYQQAENNFNYLTQKKNLQIKFYNRILFPI